MVNAGVSRHRLSPVFIWLDRAGRSPSPTDASPAIRTAYTIIIANYFRS
jgi:hypothetical protein